MDLLTDYIMMYFNMIVRILLMIASYLFTSIISERIQRSYNDFTYGKIENKTAGCETAISILHKNNIHNIAVLPKTRFFSNSFSRKQKRITLSQKNL